MAYLFPFFFAGDDSHEHADVFTRPIANQMNEDKPGAQENKQSVNDKTTFNDGAISSGNSVFCSFKSSSLSCLFLSFL